MVVVRLGSAGLGLAQYTTYLARIMSFNLSNNEPQTQHDTGAEYEHDIVSPSDILQMDRIHSDPSTQPQQCSVMNTESVARNEHDFLIARSVFSISPVVHGDTGGVDFLAVARVACGVAVVAFDVGGSGVNLAALVGGDDRILWGVSLWAAPVAARCG